MRRLTMKAAWGLAVVPLLGACASGGAIRQLGPLELRAIHSVDSALVTNTPLIRAATADLGELGADYAELEFELELSLTKAKRLEAMQAPWASPSDDLIVTQKAVVLYHLYEVEVAEQKVLEARMAERRASANEVFEAYQRLTPLLQSAGENMETLLEHLNQPTSAQIRLAAQSFLSEVGSFRATLQASANPELQALAADVARYEAFADRAREQASGALESILRRGGNEDG